ncbi:MFS transporter [Pelagibius sp. Alg239-R121]|uniref:MFS transporter n=1 Tax=Pelagibius sp. Alg239-R121 TaxID=2993448 RepID=UPI0024A6DE42|nr:MFS transporter [Pelagibius sp. Alg239-R121]
MKQSTTWHSSALEGLTMAIVTGLSLLLLIYVGTGEAKRTFSHFQVEKLAAQGRSLQNKMEHFLRPGLPLKQFVGFRASAEALLTSDATISSIAAFDARGQVAFEHGAAAAELLADAEPLGQNESKTFTARQSETTLQVILPLRNRFETVGSLTLSMPLSLVEERVQKSFQPVLIASAIAAITFGLFVALQAPQLAGRRRRWMQIVYGLIFTSISAIVIATLVSLYSDGAQAKTKGLADSLGQRIGNVLRLNLNILEVKGLERVFLDFKQLHPDIRSAGLVIDGQVGIHTDDGAVGKSWTTEAGDYEYTVDLGVSAGRSVHVAVAVPSDIVVRQTARSVKNFAALFLASAFMAGIFLQFAGSVQMAQRSRQDDGTETSSTQQQRALLLVKPVFFVAVLSEHLTYAFLPQLVQAAAQTAGFSEGAASMAFTTYFIAFASTLIPAGFYAQRKKDARPLMYAGLVISGSGLLTLALMPTFEAVLVARTLSGLGQGMLFIGVQSYILAAAAPSERTRGAGIIVFGFQGGMISGMAIGSLLVTQLGTQGVFFVASAVALTMTVYTFAAVPKVKSTASLDETGRGLRSVFADISDVIRNLEFLRTITLIGIPAKAVLTGVIIFALPLLMQAAGYRQEDIGQVLMIYAVAVVVCSAYISRSVDRSGQTRSVLVFGALLSGVGMVIIGLTSSQSLAFLPSSPMVSTILLVVGAATTGAAHGLINAPVVTHVVDSPISQQIGEAPAAAAYRFLERVGHVTGPLLIGQLFAFYGQSPMVILYIGIVVAVFGLFFAVRFTPIDNRVGEREESSQ